MIYFLNHFFLILKVISQAEWITCYSIYPDVTTNFDYALHIIDTPDLVDNSEVSEHGNNEIINQIRQLFSLPGEEGVVCLDAVCFLVNAPDARLTPSEKCLLDAIMHWFGEDIKKNICVFVTIAESQKPPILTSLAEVCLPNKINYIFDNLTLFAGKKERENDKYDLWKTGMQSLCSLFENLGIMETKSLKMTSEDLNTMKYFENAVQYLCSLISGGLVKIFVLEEKMSILEKHEKHIQEDIHCIYEVTELAKENIPGKKQNSTYCLTCNYMCHKDCSVSEDNKIKCIVILNGKCTVCPGHCERQLHCNTPYTTRFNSKNIKKTYHEITSANWQFSSKTQALQGMADMVRKIKMAIVQLLVNVNQFNNRLKEITHKNPMETTEYIKCMIKEGTREQKYGYMTRVKILEVCLSELLVKHKELDFLSKEQQSKTSQILGSAISTMYSLV